MPGSIEFELGQVRVDICQKKDKIEYMNYELYSLQIYLSIPKSKWLNPEYPEALKSFNDKNNRSILEVF